MNRSVLMIPKTSTNMHFHKIKTYIVTHRDGREQELEAMTAYFARERGAVLLGCDRDDIVLIEEKDEKK